MSHVAVADLASAFGTFHSGDSIPEDLPEPVREAWEAAGLIETAVVAAPETAPEAPAETAVVAAPEKRAHRRSGPVRKASGQA